MPQNGMSDEAAAQLYWQMHMLSCRDGHAGIRERGSFFKQDCL